MKKWLLVVGIGALLSAAGVAGAIFLLREEKTEIKTETISAHRGEGKIIKGENQAGAPTRLKTNGLLVFESAEIKTDKPKSNAAILNWDQADGTGKVEV